MANNNGCGCNGRRNNNNGFGCLNSVSRRCRWDNYPFFDGFCPDANGEYDCDCDGGDREEIRRRQHRSKFGIFTAMAPMAVAANGIIPLVNNSCPCSGNNLAANCGMITIAEGGTYLATLTARAPEGAKMDSTITLNVNDASQSSAVTQVGGTAPFSFTSQAVFDVCDHATVTLRSTDAVNITESSVQPLFTLTLVRLD